MATVRLVLGINKVHVVVFDSDMDRDELLSLKGRVGDWKGPLTKKHLVLVMDTDTSTKH